MAKTHPHIDSPTAEQLAALVEDRPPEIAQAYLALHELVIAAVPEIRFSVDEVDASIGYGARQYGYNGWGMAAVTPHSKWARLTLLQGSELEDPEKLLTGTTTMRHFKPTAVTQVEENSSALRQLILEAAALHK